MATPPARLRSAAAQRTLASRMEASGSLWIPSASARTYAARQRVTYEDAPAWDAGRGCSGRILPGATALGEFLRRRFQGIRAVEGYSCRPNTADTSRLSVHGTGRAIDLMVTPIAGRPDLAHGDVIADWLVRNAAAVGIQYFIWARTAYHAARPDAPFSPYTGPNPHIDHLHVEITHAAAVEATPWFVAGRPAEMPPPQAPFSLPSSSTNLMLGAALVTVLVAAAAAAYARGGSD